MKMPKKEYEQAKEAFYNNVRDNLKDTYSLTRAYEEYMDAVKDELKAWQKRINRTIYISKKRLLKDIELIDDFYLRNMADYVLEHYPNCKYYIYKPDTDTLKPSKRK